MKKLILGAVLSATALFSNEIDVKITNLLNTNGNVLIGLYNKESSFSNMSKIFKGTEERISNDTLQYTFTDIPNGTYAIAIIHDENKNSNLDKNFFGIPSEGYGFSNNIRPTFRSASFDESKFKLSSNTNITIKMGY